MKSVGVTPSAPADSSSIGFVGSKPNEALPQTDESWLVLTGVGRAPLLPVW